MLVLMAAQYRVYSPESRSFSQVTSANRSDSVKKHRPQIEDAERESRPEGRTRASSYRLQRSTSAPKPGRTTSVKRTRSSGGLPIDRRKMKSADEELDAKIKEMEDQGDQLYQIQRLEDENSADRNMYNNKMQSIKDECSEFDHQYNQALLETSRRKIQDVRDGT